MPDARATHLAACLVAALLLVAARASAIGPGTSWTLRVVPSTGAVTPVPRDPGVDHAPPAFAYDCWRAGATSPHVVRPHGPNYEIAPRAGGPGAFTVTVGGDARDQVMWWYEHGNYLVFNARLHEFPPAPDENHDVVVAVDLAARRVAWRVPGALDVSGCHAFAPDRLELNRGHGIEVFDLATGAPAWRAGTLPALHVDAPLGGGRWIGRGEGHGMQESDALIAVDLAAGRTLWRARGWPIGELVDGPRVFDVELRRLDPGTADVVLVERDAATGAARRTTTLVRAAGLTDTANATIVRRGPDELYVEVDFGVLPR